MARDRENRTFLTCLGIMLLGCVTTPAPKATKPQEPTAVARRTILPTQFGGSSLTVEPRILPKRLLRIGTILRPRAEVREGPGLQFELHSTVLRKGAKAAMFDRVGVWQKVMSLDGNVQGWVHRKAISAGEFNGTPLVIDLENLPTVFPVRDVDTVFAFGTKKKIKVHIPKGTYFHLLHKTDRRALVWLKETNSLLWFARNDVD